MLLLKEIQKKSFYFLCKLEKYSLLSSTKLFKKNCLIFRVFQNFILFYKQFYLKSIHLKVVEKKHKVKNQNNKQTIPNFITVKILHNHF